MGSTNLRWPSLPRRRYSDCVEAFAAPYKVVTHAQRLLSLPAIRLRFALAGIPWGRGWRVFGMPIIQKHLGSRVVLGDYLELRSSRRSNPLCPHQPVVFATRARGAEITVGPHCGLTGVVLVAEERISIGAHVLLGANVVICDTDFHPLDPGLRRTAPQAGQHRPVVIEDDVFVGTQALILKGVQIGRGAVVGAGAVVSRNVAPFSIVAGNPARVIGKVGST